LESKAESYLGRDQYGFRKGCGTRDAIAAMRELCDRSLEHNNKVYVCKNYMFEELAKVNGQRQPGHTGVWHEDKCQEDESNVHLTSGQVQG